MPSHSAYSQPQHPHFTAQNGLHPYFEQPHLPQYQSAPVQPIISGQQRAYQAAQMQMAYDEHADLLKQMADLREANSNLRDAVTELHASRPPQKSHVSSSASHSPEHESYTSASVHEHDTVVSGATCCRLLGWPNTFMPQAQCNEKQSSNK